jgi:putative endonuclease
MKYFVYIVLCSDNTLYTGISTDIVRRMNEHNNSKRGSKYTRSRRPVKLVYVEECLDKSSALKRELSIKKLSRKNKLKLIR